MEINENIAGLGKDHDENARENDIPKKQSEARPAAENIDMEPHSVNKTGKKEFDPNAAEEETPIDVTDVHVNAEEYAKKEHEKAEGWENTNESGPDTPQF